MIITLRYRGRVSITRPHCSLVFYSATGTRILHLSTQFSNIAFPRMPSSGVIECRIARLPLIAGKYMLNVAILGSEGLLDHIESAAIIEVQPADVYGTGNMPIERDGFVICEQQWRVEDGRP